MPRNQAIQLNGAIDPRSVELQTVAGQKLAFEQREFRWREPCGGDYSIEIIPTPALEPDTQFEVRAKKRTIAGPNVVVEEPVFFRFTTSAELLPDPELAVPSAELVLVQPPVGSTTSCGPYAATGCLSTADPSNLLMILREGDTVTNEFPLSEADTPLLLWQMPSCIDVVRTAPTGRRSPALSFCGDDLMLLAKPQNQCQAGPFAGGPVQHEADPPSAGAGAPSLPMAVAGEGAPQPMAAEEPHKLVIHGCAVVAGPGTNGGAVTFGLSLGLLTLLRWRRRR